MYGKITANNNRNLSKLHNCYLNKVCQKIKTVQSMVQQL